MELHQLMEMGDVETTTFGPLNKYVPANDNVPQAKRLKAEEVFGNWFSSSHLEKTPQERLPGAIKWLSRLPGYIYLGSAYSKYEAGHDAASRVAADAAARLMAAGLCIFAPIPHGHTITLAGDLPKDWKFWKKQCDPMIAAASAIVVLTMAGWKESVGLQYEIGEFARQGKPILHASPSDLMTLREAA